MTYNAELSPICVLFTKLFRDRPFNEISEVAAGLGFDGVDLLVRDGFSVTPQNHKVIPAVVRDFHSAGVPVRMATTDFIDVDNQSEPVFRTLSEAGVSQVRAGYWLYDRSRPYVHQIDEANRQLDRLERLAEDLGLTILLQLHGGTLHSSGSLAYRMLENRNPENIGAYIDPGNQSVQDGREEWHLTFDILSDYLRCLGLKNGGWFPAQILADGGRMWESDWLGVPDGMVPWGDILRHLKTVGFDGILSFHGHYEIPFGQILDQTLTDLRYVRRIIDGSKYP